MDGVAWFGLSEERAGRQRNAKTVARKQTPQHTRVVAWRGVCVMVWYGVDCGGVSESVVMECGGMVD